CVINVKTDLPYPEPVFIRNNNLWIPSDGKLNWGLAESNLISCPRSGVVNSTIETTLLTCVAGNLYILNGELVNISQVVCSRPVTGDREPTNKPCANSGTIHNIGFQIDGVGFVKHFDVCYNAQTSSVVYTKHMIPGDSIVDSIVESYRPSFKVAGVPSGTAPDAAYTIKSQLTRLTQLLGSSQQAAKFVSNLSYLARGHMTPDADGIFRTWQWDTYFFINVAPQWQKVNGGNWLAIEKLGRTIADQLQHDVIVYTGTYDVLTLPHVNGTMIPITLSTSGIEVPKWTWKILKSSATNSAIAFVTSNNPYRTTIDEDEFLCPDICKNTGWYTPSFDIFPKGFTYCCTVNSLNATIKYIPDDANAVNILGNK
uniref:DNA/RNA non-specific endonuclease domain-containing protein n=2 Tax=Anopheles albimanus TaxID=7167 RepID=A0A182FLR6_ANOAL